MIYFFSILFIIMNIYYLLNYKRLDKPFEERDRNSKLDLLYYVLKLFSWFWFIFGLTYENNLLFILLLGLGLIRIPIYHINKILANLLYRLTPPIHIVILIFLLFTH